MSNGQQLKAYAQDLRSSLDLYSRKGEPPSRSQCIEVSNLTEITSFDLYLNIVY